MSTMSRNSTVTPNFDGITSIMQSIYLKKDENVPDPLPAKDTFQKFITGSSYSGAWNDLGMTGYGEFTYPHGVIYRGTFKDGEFDGKGTLHYPMGQVMHGVWEDGELISWSYEFFDGLLYEEPWNYSQVPDRRYYISQKHGLEAACNENLTATLPPRPVPSDCYDCGEGIFKPGLAVTISAYDKNKILRIPTADEEMWIKANCRAGKRNSTGLRRDLYETWTSGRKHRSSEDVSMVHEDIT